MKRLFSLWLPVALAGCAGQAAPPAPPVSPAPAAVTSSSPGQVPDSNRRAPTPAAAPTLPAADAGDSARADSLAALELARAADSAADVDILERLAQARPDPADTTAEVNAEPHVAHGAPPAGLSTAPVTWDIDVESFNAHDRVQYYLDFFQTAARDRMAIWLTRLPSYESMIRARFREHGLPGDLVYLALIESGYSNTAVSRSRAVGMWQFMKGTGKLYGLRIDPWVDERRDPYKATTAAARLLANLRDHYGSLYLAAAAYNAGAGKVDRGIRRLHPDDKDSLSDASFFKLYDTRFLRRETRDYVPKLIAAALIAKEPERYGFERPPATDSVLPDSIIVPDATGLDVIARLADTTLSAIRDLNPQYIRLMTPPRSRMVVRVPPGKGLQVAAAYAVLPHSERVTYIEHFVAKGETLGQIARKYGMSVEALLVANPQLKPKALRIGQRIVLPTSGHLPSREVLASLADPKPRHHARAGVHKVRTGESLWSIARTYGVTVGQLRAWNGLGREAPLRPGQTIRVIRPGDTSAATGRRGAPERTASHRGGRGGTPIGRARSATPVWQGR